MVVIQKFLKEFYEYSGLMLNANKSEIFCSGVSEDELQLMTDVSGFKVGRLPVRYLGIPFGYKKACGKVL